ncbi:hypothetical protein FGG08_002901 [Glutinoglossum americanum]|uniref:Uncharacterized protein n=1 Tax=Glutinoglossum americanum TaxID=1670608 RepID=A0A9P8I3Y4_9PEZI|nr:hypothetical protein FGG08_002901 [Glutinoglossum americanum]
MTSSVWLITGCSSGFGAEIAKAALARGDKVIATARSVAKLEELKALGATTVELDITAGDAHVQKAVDEALRAYGRIDILVNNAGYVVVGGIEEFSDEEAKSVFETNVFGQLAVIRAVMPHMRAQKSGTVANIGSVGGWKGEAGFGTYCATKFALVGLTQGLRAEVAHLGINVTIIEPGYFRTNLLSSGARVSARKVIEDLRPSLDPLRNLVEGIAGQQPGDPVKGARVIVEALTGSGRCQGRRLPERLLLGRDAVGYVKAYMDEERKGIEEWADVVSTTDHDDVVVS